MKPAATATKTNAIQTRPSRGEFCGGVSMSSSINELPVGLRSLGRGRINARFYESHYAADNPYSGRTMRVAPSTMVAQPTKVVTKFMINQIMPARCFSSYQRMFWVYSMSIKLPTGREQI